MGIKSTKPNFQSGTYIYASEMNSEFSDVIDDIEDLDAREALLLKRDGTRPMTGDLDMNGHNIDSASQYYIKNGGINMIKFLGNIFAQVSLYPQTDNSLHLGDSGVRWSDVYAMIGHFDTKVILDTIEEKTAGSGVTIDGCLITDNVKHHTTYNGVVIDEALRIKKGDGTDEAIIHTMWDDSYITITGGLVGSIAGQLILCGPASGFPGSILARVSNAAQTNYKYAFKILGASNTPKIEVEYGMKTDLIEEKTSNNGVTIDGCLIKDGYLHIPNHTPSSASDTGIAGQICYDANYIYVCIATNTWKRVAISSW